MKIFDVTDYPLKEAIRKLEWLQVYVRFKFTERVLAIVELNN